MWTFDMLKLIINVLLFWTVYVNSAVPGAVQNIKLESEFPDTPLKVSFNKPTTGASNTFLKYRITVVPQFGGGQSCIIRWIVVCDGCGDTTVGHTETFTKNCSAVTKYNAATYKSTDSSYSFLFKDTEIEPSEFYKVHIEAGNTDGWGAAASKTIPSGQYKSSKVRNLITSYNSSNDMLNIKWTIPVDQQGKVQRYQMWIVDASSKKCLLSRTITCGDCSVLELGNKDEQDLSGCMDKKDLKYDEVQDNFAVNIENYFNRSLQLKFNDTNLIINVNAVNKYGWGNVNSTSGAVCKVNDECCRQLSVNFTHSSERSTIKFTLIKQTECNVNQYNAWVTDASGKCLWWTKLTCKGCAPQLLWQRGQHDLANCTYINTTTFSNNSETVSLKTNTKLSDGSTVYVAPVTLCGWCKPTNVTKKLPPACTMIPCGISIIMVFLAIIVIVVLIYFYLKKKKNKDESHTLEGPTNQI